MYTPGWGIVTLCEVPVAGTVMVFTSIVYPLEGAGDGAIQVTSTVARLICSAVKSVTGAPNNRKQQSNTTACVRCLSYTISKMAIFSEGVLTLVNQIPGGHFSHI